MRIKYLEFKNLSEDYEIERVDFFDNLTLLVGVSGAGKTQILRALRDVCSFAVGRELSYAFRAKLGMQFKEGETYEWNVVTELNELSTGKSDAIRIVEESLTDNRGKCVFSKKEEEVALLEYDKVPALKEDESLISLYRNLEEIGKVYAGLEDVELSNLERDLERTMPADIIGGKNPITPEVASILSGSMHWSPFDRFGFMKIADNEKYKKAKDAVLEEFQEVFPMVQEIDYRKNHSSEYGIVIKTNNRWVYQRAISSGMLKTLWHILNLRTAPRNAVILLDEFENGLGINCIDVVSSMIMEERSDIQVIITSHHPYIINKIPMSNWKIVRRKKKKVITVDAKEYNLGESKHEAYIQLMNKLQYEE